jgi:hypothetical protein
MYVRDLERGIEKFTFEGELLKKTAALKGRSSEIV